MRALFPFLLLPAACTPVIDAESEKMEAVLHGTPAQLCAAWRKLERAYVAAERHLEAEIENRKADEYCNGSRPRAEAFAWLSASEG